MTFVPIKGQEFISHQQWVHRATRSLTNHPEYNNTEHGDIKGWRGHHFTAICFDQKGRRCRIGGDFMRATDEDAYPIWYIWPDQIVDLLKAPSDLVEALQDIAAEEPRMTGADNNFDYFPKLDHDEAIYRARAALTKDKFVSQETHTS